MRRWEAWWVEIGGYNHRQREERAGRMEWEEEDYVVFPRSIFFWMARAEW